jgi:hypothetical protein
VANNTDPKSTSFRAILKGTISDFLDAEGMRCPATEDGLLEIVVSLSHYTEEGRRLHPKLIVCDDLDTLLPIIQCTDHIEMGIGPRAADTMLQALKRCAPLSDRYWVVYVLREQNNFRYGIFRAPTNPTALDVRDTLDTLSQEQNDTKAFLIYQLADKAVEMIGIKSGCQRIYLSATKDDQPAPRDEIGELIKTVSLNAPEKFKEPMDSFLRTTLVDALKRSHGTLIVVVPENKVPDELLQDGVFLPTSIQISIIVENHQTKPTDGTLSTLLSYKNLIEGMIGSDGILVFNDKAEIMGYNCFVKSGEKPDAKPRELIGGARRRAFEQLCQMVNNKVLSACYMQSSDGEAICKIGE